MCALGKGIRLFGVWESSLSFPEVPALVEHLLPLPPTRPLRSTTPSLTLSHTDAEGTFTAHLERFASGSRLPHSRRPRRGGSGWVVSPRPAKSAWWLEGRVSPRGTVLQARPPPSLRGRPRGAARCVNPLGLRCEWSSGDYWLLLLPRRRPLLFELWEAGGSQAAGVRSSRQRPHPGVLCIPTACPLPLPTRPPTHSLTHPPTHPEPGRKPRSRGPAASSPRSWTSSCRRTRLPRVPQSRRLLTPSAPDLGVFRSPSSQGAGARVASGPS